MKKTCRLLCCILATLMMIGCIVGCSDSGEIIETSWIYVDEPVSDDSSVSQSADPNAEETQSKPGTESVDPGKPVVSTNTPDKDVKVVNNCYQTGYPIAKEEVTFNVMIKANDSGSTDYSKLPINSYLEDKLNIKFTWQVVTQDAMISKMTLAYASNTLPDIFMGMAPSGYKFHWRYIQQGQIIKLDEYLDTYGPNIKKMFEAEPEAKYICTAPDNGIYMLPMIDKSNPVKKFMKVMYINKKWLNNLGLEKPTTTEEFANVLRAFKNGDPNGNGRADEIPLVMPYFEPQLLGAFGISTYNNLYYVDDSDNVQYAAVQNAYREALIYYRNLYTEDLIDKNTFLTSQVNANQVIAQVANQSVETVGCFMTTDSGLVMDAERAYNDYEVLGPLTGPNGTCTYTNQVLEDMWPDWFLVTKACKYPEIAVRLADYFYSTEGTYTAMYGPQGQGWRYNEEGKVILRSNDRGSWQYQFTPGQVLPHYASTNFMDAFAETTPETMSEKVYAKNYEDRIKLYTPVIPTKVFPQMNYTDEENSSISTLTSTVSQYMQESTNTFLTGTQSVENYWDGYVANLKKIGLDELLKIQNDAYDRYLQFEESIK